MVIVCGVRFAEPGAASTRTGRFDRVLLIYFYLLVLFWGGMARVLGVISTAPAVSKTQTGIPISVQFDSAIMAVPIWSGNFEAGAPN